MKIFFLINFLCLFCYQKKINKKAKKDSIDSIKTYQMDFSIAPVVSIRCSELPTKKDINVFDASPFKERIAKDLLNPQKAPVNYGSDENAIDARVRMYIWYSSGKVDTVCLCFQQSISINNNIFLLDDHNDIYKLLDSLYDSRHFAR
jgi:hypothetical protein